MSICDNFDDFCVYILKGYLYSDSSDDNRSRPSSSRVRTYLLYVYVCINVCIYACIQVSKTSMQVCVCVFFMQIVVYVCMYVCMYVCKEMNQILIKYWKNNLK